MTRLFLLTLLTLVFSSNGFAGENAKSISIATWNLEWFFDADTGDNISDLAKQKSAPSRDEWEWKLAGVASAIAKMRPTILALQEVENRRVLRQLTQRLSDKYGLSYRIAFIEGWDSYTEQDVAVIYRSGLVQFSFREQTSEMFDSREFYNLNKHVFAEFRWNIEDGSESLLLLNVHLRATPEKAELRQKQCKLIRAWLGDEIEKGRNVVVIGDMNTEELADAVANGSDMAILAGWDTVLESDDLVDLNRFLKGDLRGTHQSGNQYDRILVSGALFNNEKAGKDLAFSKIENFRKSVVVGSQDRNHFNEYYGISQAQRDYSDHYPLMAEFEFK